jgi:hypothetical protein
LGFPPRYNLLCSQVKRAKRETAFIVIQQASLTSGTSPVVSPSTSDDADDGTEAKLQANIRLLDVANSLTKEQLHEFEMK